MFAMDDSRRSKMINSNVPHGSRTEGTDPLSILLEARFEPCQVCGEQSSGLHCGAITCEACKKFFLRSINGEDQKYKCVKNKDCMITRNTRTQCQYCRFQKCLMIGMTVKEGIELQQTPRVADIFAQISCYVCQGPSSGIHFGAITCEGCKGFFRRSIKERAPSRYKCMDNGTCEITVSTRNACRYCRFQRCITVGMSVEGSRIGRQSNLFKHHMRMMLQSNGQMPNTTMLHQMVHSTSSTRNRTTNKRRIIDESSSSESDLTHSTSTFIDFEDQLDPQCRQLISNIHKAFKETLDNLSICQDSTDICIIILCLHHSDQSSFWNYFNTNNQKLNEQFQQLFPFIEYIRSDVEKLQTYMFALKLDDKEFSLFLSLLIISTSNLCLNDFLLIDSTQTELTCALCDYMDCKRGSKSRDFYTLMLLLPSLKKLNITIQDYIKNQVPRNVQLPAFFSRVYLNEQNSNNQSTEL
ncbi:hypothetical protein I4U23_002927 [Adineta vaga]|nr:hypothetical protein I4U23_002927 [Adineta vaga]